MQKEIMFFSLFFVLVSCTEVMEMESWPVRNALVINSYITPDSVFSCYITQLKALPDTNVAYVAHAVVKVYNKDTGEELSTLAHVKEGYYRAKTAKPKAMVIYQLVVEAEDYPTAKACTYIPEKAVPDSVYYKYDAGEEAIGQFVDPFDELCFTVNDKDVNDNYYEIASGAASWSKVRWDEALEKYVEREDSLFCLGDFRELSYFTNNDAVISNEDLMRYEPKFLLFSDALFDKTTHSFKIRCELGKPYASHLYFTLYTLSEDLYRFRKTLVQHQFEEGKTEINGFASLAQLDFANTAIDVYSNVEGGYGIFAGFNYSMKFSKISWYKRNFINEENTVIGEEYNQFINLDQDSIQ